jgi:acetyl-CoA carboxylase carboxyl transferase subunit alpha
MTPWQRVNMARHPEAPDRHRLHRRARPASTSCTATVISATIRAIVGGFAKLRGRRVIAIAQDKGRDTKEKVLRNFGMPSPEGYRKVIRLVRLAAHLGLPVVTFIDTSGADPGIGSEERAQAEAIAQSLYELAEVPVPIVATIIGEGGSGGALALALADRVMMLQHAVYSVASPEGAAAILWGDAGRAEEAASRLKLTSDDLLEFGIVDEVIPEPLGGAHRDPAGVVGKRARRGRPRARRVERRRAGRACATGVTGSSAAPECRRCDASREPIRHHRAGARHLGTGRRAVRARDQAQRRAGARAPFRSARRHAACAPGRSSRTGRSAA